MFRVTRCNIQNNIQNNYIQYLEYLYKLIAIALAVLVAKVWTACTQVAISILENKYLRILTVYIIIYPYQTERRPAMQPQE